MYNLIIYSKYVRLLAIGVVIALTALLFDPASATAQDGLVPDCDADCGWEDFIEMTNTIINWLITIATSVAVLLFMYAGFLYLTSGGDESQVKQATTIFTNVAVGFAIMLIAWLLVITIVSLLTGDNWIEDNEDLLPISL